MYTYFIYSARASSGCKPRRRHRASLQAAGFKHGVISCRLVCEGRFQPSTLFTIMKRLQHLLRKCRFFPCFFFPLASLHLRKLKEAPQVKGSLPNRVFVCMNTYFTCASTYLLDYAWNCVVVDLFYECWMHLLTFLGIFKTGIQLCSLFIVCTLISNLVNRFL